MVVMVVAIVLLEGCYPTRMNTRSGNPEVTVRGVPMNAVWTAYAHELAGKGFAVRYDKFGNLMTVIGTKGVNVGSGDNTTANITSGSGGGRVKAEVTLHFRQEDDGVRVVYHGYIGRVEAREDWKARQAKLERVAKELEAAH
jgi:hypothetical protein